MKIKTRFSPSPTGDLHIGSVRTALYSWLFARKYGGEFILRIEDTDLKRSTQHAINNIMHSMHWLNIDWDKGPYYQTKRFKRYNMVIKEMLKNGHAYKCYCSRARLENVRKQQIENKTKPRYDGHCRNNLFSNNQPYVIRFRNPQEGSVVFNDQIRGYIEFSNKELDDLIICRDDGVPTYNLCVVIDDWDMEITHVIRGEDHINNTPRQINILKALGADIPSYAHVSMILGDDGKKISKRERAVGIMQYRDNGYLPDALLNYLVRLGWSEGDKEIFSINEMKKFFNLNTVSKSSSTFNLKKLQWINQYYINHLEPEYVAKYLQFHMDQEKIDITKGPTLINLINILGKRCKTLKEIACSCRYFYTDLAELNIDYAKKYLNPNTRFYLEIMSNKLSTIMHWTIENIHKTILKTIDELNLSMKTVGMPLRVAITGGIQSPSLDVTLHAIGQARSLARIKKGLEFIDYYKDTGFYQT